MARPSHTILSYRKCVGTMVLNNEGKVWAGHRPVTGNSEFPASNGKCWQAPQGGIDRGESPLAAARRELWEETGITSVTLLAEVPEWVNYDLPEYLVGKALKGKYRGQTQKWFAFRFEGEEEEINISRPPGGAPVEFDQWRWFNADELIHCVVDFKRESYIRVVTAFKHLF